MKGNARRSRQRPWRARLAVLSATAASLALVSAAAQTPLRWDATQPSQPSAAEAATAPPAAPAASTIARAPGPAAMPLARDFDVRTFEAMAQELVANQRVPGLAMAIVHDGKVLSARGYGITDVRAAEPVDAHTVFRLASLSKPFAATVTGMLVSEGALRWDSHVNDFMPALRFSDPTAAQRLTVADVLSHRVGLTRNTYDRDIERNADYHDLVQRLALAPMNCAPGDCYSYQNVAFSLVGDVVFAATGQFFGEAVASRIFKPLGMNDASYGLDGIEASARWARPPAPAAWQRQLPGGAPGLAMRAAKGPRQQLAQIAGAEQRRVQLEIDGQAAGVRPAAQALDQVDFPGRAVQVQALAVQPRNQLTQLPLAARSRKCGNAKVVFDVDAAVDGVTRRAPQAPLDTPGPWRDGQRLLPLPRQAQRGLVDLAHRAQIQQHTHVQRRVAPFQREPAALQRAECVLVHAPILVQAVLQHSPLL